MFALVYLTTLLILGSFGYCIYRLSEQRVMDQQTIAWLRRRNADRRKKIEELEEKIRIMEVF